LTAWTGKKSYFKYKKLKLKLRDSLLQHKNFHWHRFSLFSFYFSLFVVLYVVFIFRGKTKKLKTDWDMHKNVAVAVVSILLLYFPSLFTQQKLFCFYFFLSISRFMFVCYSLLENFYCIKLNFLTSSCPQSCHL
jgi:hypothetical protein